MCSAGISSCGSDRVSHRRHHVFTYSKIFTPSGRPGAHHQPSAIVVASTEVFMLLNAEEESPDTTYTIDAPTGKVN